MHQGYSTSEPPNLAQLQDTMRKIEVACSAIQMHVNPAEAEATILSLCRSPRPYQACQFILEKSQLANAKFQAATAIRDAAIREWGLLVAEEKRSLISFCLCFLMQHASSPERFVQAKVSSVAAQLMKRGWLEFTAAEKEAFFYEVKRAVTGIHGLDMQHSGINFLESLVSEFSPSTATSMGLPREFHEQCQKSLELDHLKTFYCWAQNAALSVSSRIIESNSVVPEVKVCSVALRLMSQILNWDFCYNSNGVEGARKGMNIFSGRGRENSGSPKRTECVLVQPGPSWRDILFSSGHIGWVLSLYGALRQKFSCEGYWIDCPIAVSARKLIVQFCSLTGTIFPSDNRHMLEQHLQQLISGFIQWIDPPDAISNEIDSGKSESEMLDGCRALLSIATVATPLLFDQLLKSMRPFGTLTLLSSLMCAVVKSLMSNHTEEEPWSWVARDILLDSWTAILLPMGTSCQHAFLPAEGVMAAASLFALIVESELKAASQSLLNDENDLDYFQASISAMDERLTSYALIGRTAIDFTIPLLLKLFSESVTRLHQVTGISDPSQTLEELYSLLLIIGHVLADECEGETPLIPKAIENYTIDHVDAGQHPLVALSGSIIKFAEQSLDSGMRASIFSPRLLEAIIWFLARWSCTYLMPPEESREKSSSENHQLDHHQSQCSQKKYLRFFDENNQGKVVLDVIVRISMAMLFSYPGEKDLQALTCYQLLQGLVQRKHVCVHLVALDSWRDLANAFANDRILFSLNTAHQRSLSQTLILSASGIRNSEASNQYIRNLMGHMTAYLVEMSGKNDLRNVAQQPYVILMVSCMLERLRGAARASEPRTQKAIFEMGFSVLSPVLVFLEIYKHESAVVYLLLKYVVDWVDGQIIYLEAKETAVVVDFCMQLLQLYSSHNIGKISISLSSSLLSEAEMEKYKDIRALLQLLTNLCSKDLVDFSSDPVEAQPIKISEAVYLGLRLVTNLITLEMLKYPKLCHDYFSLMSHLLEVYPEMVTNLDREAFSYVVRTIGFGLHNQEIEVVSMCLGALQALASYHYKETGGGKVGLGSLAIGYNDPADGKWHEGILSGFLRSLLQFLLFQDYSTDLVSAAADALFPLILCEQGLYQRLGNELIERQGDLVLKTRLADALQALTGSNQLSSALDRANYQKFRRNLHHFLVEVRGFLRTI